MKTIALVMSGQLRTLDSCVASLRQHIIEPIIASGSVPTIFVHGAADSDAHKAYEHLPEAQIVIEDQPTLDEKNYILRSGKGVMSIQGVLRQFWTWREAWRMVERSEAETGQQFDAAVRLRADSLYYSSIEDPAHWLPGFCYVPRFSNFWGVCDRFGFGEREVIERWHTIWDRLDERMAQGWAFHPESIVNRDLEDAGYFTGRTDVLFATARADGNLRPPEFVPELGDVVKR